MKQCMDAENLHRRLKKIIGQIQAIDRMIDEDVPCEDILSQLNAAKSWKGISSIASVTVSNMGTQIKPSSSLQKLSNAFQIWAD